MALAVDRSAGDPSVASAHPLVQECSSTRTGPGAHDHDEGGLERCTFGGLGIPELLHQVAEMYQHEVAALRSELAMLRGADAEKLATDTANAEGDHAAGAGGDPVELPGAMPGEAPGAPSAPATEGPKRTKPTAFDLLQNFPARRRESTHRAPDVPTPLTGDRGQALQAPATRRKAALPPRTTQKAQSDGAVPSFSGAVVSSSGAVPSSSSAEEAAPVSSSSLASAGSHTTNGSTCSATSEVTSVSQAYLSKRGRSSLEVPPKNRSKGTRTHDTPASSSGIGIGGGNEVPQPIQRRLHKVESAGPIPSRSAHRTLTDVAHAAVDLINAHRNSLSSNSSFLSSAQTDRLQLWEAWDFNSAAGDESGSASPTTAFAAATRLIPVKTLNQGTGTMDFQPLRRDTTSCAGRIMMRPATSRRLVWDFMGLLCIMWDLIWIPLQTFGPPQLQIVYWFQWFQTVFWTLDIPARFFVGYNTRDGMIEMRFTYVARKYLCTWFCLDLALVLLDWTVYVIESGDDTLSLFRALKSVRIGKSLRLVRVVKIVRLIRANQMFQDIVDQVSSVYILVFGRMFGMLLSVILCNHFIACAWYALSTLDMPRTWVNRLDRLVETDSHVFLYATSLHWSLTQFTPASMDVVPANVFECTFNICVLIFALVVFTQLVGSITSTMTELKNLNAEEIKNKTKLRQFLGEHRLSMNLVTRIWGCVHAAKSSSRSRRVKEGDVELLSKLPRCVMAELHNEIYSPTFMLHPFFASYALHNPSGMSKVYGSAMADLPLEPGEELFTMGESGENMFFVVSGQLFYKFGRGDAAIEVDSYKKEVYAGEWVCEVTLWLKWKHMGKLVATDHCTIFSLNADKFRRIIGNYVGEDQMLRKYAALFRQHAPFQMEHLDTCSEFSILQDLAWCAIHYEDITMRDDSGFLSLVPARGENYVGPMESWHDQLHKLRLSSERVVSEKWSFVDGMPRKSSRTGTGRRQSWN